jgi:hypothetical protein
MGEHKRERIGLLREVDRKRFEEVRKGATRIGRLKEIEKVADGCKDKDSGRFKR